MNHPRDIVKEMLDYSSPPSQHTIDIYIYFSGLTIALIRCCWCILDNVKCRPERTQLVQALSEDLKLLFYIRSCILLQFPLGESSFL